MDREFLNCLNSNNLTDLRISSKQIALRIIGILEKFKNEELPNDVLDLLKSKSTCISFLKRSLYFEECNLNELNNAKTVFSQWNLEDFIIASNSLENFNRVISKYKSLEEIPKNKEKWLLNHLKSFQYFDGILTKELQNQIKSKKVLTRPKILKKEVKVDLISLSTINRNNFLRVCLVQFDFNLSKTFPYKLEDKDRIREKIMKSLTIAKEN